MDKLEEAMYKDQWLLLAISNSHNKYLADIRDTTLMQIMDQEDMMNLSKIRSDKLLKLQLLINMLLQQWLEHKIIEITSPVAMKGSTQVTLLVEFQIWLLCLNHIEMLVKTPMDNQAEIKLEFMTSWETLIRVPTNTSAVKWWVLPFITNNHPKLGAREVSNNLKSIQIPIVSMTGVEFPIQRTLKSCS